MEVALSSSGMADVGAYHTADAGRHAVVLPCSPGTVNASTHNTIDAQGHVGGALPCLSGMGVDGAHNTIEKNVGAYNTAWVLSCQEGHRVLSYRCIGYGP